MHVKRGPRVSVRNGVLARGTTGAAGADAVYTVPAGHTIIVKQLLVYNPNAAATDIGWILVAPMGVSSPWTHVRTALGTTYDKLDTWFCMNEGDALTLYHTQGGIEYWVSGALLLGIL